MLVLIEDYLIFSKYMDFLHSKLSEGIALTEGSR